ncbi:hypothetical protein IC582_016476 [Cucumis melo]
MVSAKAVGDLKLFFNDRYIVLKNVLYAPQMKRNLISISCMLEHMYRISFEINEAFIFRKGIHICSAILENNLYKLRPTRANFVLNTEIFRTTETHNKRQKVSSNAFLWHLRLGHINLNRIGRLVKNGLLSQLEDNSLPPCDSYLEGKMTKRSFTRKGLRTKIPLELVHSNLCGPMNVKAREGYRYFSSFIDDYLRYGHVYLIQNKSDSFEKFKEYKAKVENESGKTIKTFQSDRGREYMDLRCQDYLIKHGVLSQLSAPSTPQQNGVSERRNRTLLDMVRSMMSFARLPDSFWGYALETSIYILNNVPSKSVSKIPYELCKGRKGSLGPFRIWGCPAHVLVQNPKKLERRSKLCLFVGYPKESKGGLFYEPQENKVFVSTNATFLEEDHIRNHQTRSKLVLEEISKNTTDRPSSSTKVVDKTRNIGQTHPSQELGEPHRNGRVVR